MAEVLPSEFMRRSEPKWLSYAYERMERNTSAALFPSGVLIIGALFYLFMPAWLGLILILVNMYDCANTFNNALERCGMAIWHRRTLMLGGCLLIAYFCHKIPARWRYLTLESTISHGLFGCGSAVLGYFEGVGSSRREMNRLWLNGVQMFMRPAGALIASQWKPLFNASPLWYFTFRAVPVYIAAGAAAMLFHCSTFKSFSWKYNPLVDTITDLWYEGDAWIYSLYVHRTRRTIRRQSKRRSAACNEDYVYHPITSGQIRLLILPRSALLDTAPIRCTLRTVTLDDPPPYYALSYCWGSGELCEELFVDGKRFRVTQAVFNFLVEQRSCLKEVYLWIDAICIDQQCLSEKSHQVAQMPEVYKRAEKTIAYLGDQYESRMCVPLLYETPSLNTLHGEAPYYLERLRSKRSTSRWRAMTWLLNNQYFRRAWIVQEVALSADLVFCIGGRLITLGDFEKAMISIKRLDVTGALHSLETHENQVRSAYTGLGSIDSLFRLRLDPSTPDDHLERAQERQLSGLVFMLAALDVTDPRDKLYAALGLASDHHPGGRLDPDYRKSTQVVMKELTEQLLVHQSRPFLQALALAGHGYSGRESACPSWVIRQVEPARPGYSIARAWHARGFHAGTKRSADCRLNPLPNTLQLRGILCDRIKALTHAQLWDLTRSQFFELHDLQHVLAARATYLEEIFELLADEDFQSDEQGMTRLALVLMGFPTQTFLEPEPNTGPHFSRLIMDYYNSLHKMSQSEDKGERTWTPDQATGSEQVVLTGFRDNKFMNHFLRTCGGRSFAITEFGRFALVPPYGQPGDQVFIPFGGQTPLLLRSTSTDPIPRGTSFELLGEMFLEGAMLGQLVPDDVEGEMVTLV